jgi:hypothetical protein
MRPIGRDPDGERLRAESSGPLARARERDAFAVQTDCAERRPPSPLTGSSARAVMSQHPGWNLVALDLGVDLSTPSGEFLASVMASAAQWERRIIGQRTKEALAVKKA